jgi:hypothetical protein
MIKFNFFITNLIENNSDLLLFFNVLWVPRKGVQTNEDENEKKKILFKADNKDEIKSILD